MTLRVKGVITLIITFCILATANSISNTYKLEQELKALKIEPEKIAAKPIEVLPLPLNVEAARKTIKPKPEEVKNEEFAPVQFIAHEEIPLAAEIQEHIETECERLEVDAAYIYALIESESSFRTGLLVEDGGGHSAGLCQINSVNWPDMEKKGLDPMNELDNITYCITLVKKYVDKYPTIDHVTTCYKAGEGGAKRLDYHLSVCDTINERTEHFNEIMKGGK